MVKYLSVFNFMGGGQCFPWRLALRDTKVKCALNLLFTKWKTCWSYKIQWRDRPSSSLTFANWERTGKFWIFWDFAKRARDCFSVERFMLSCENLNVCNIWPVMPSFRCQNFHLLRKLYGTWLMCIFTFFCILYGSRYSKMDQVKFVEDSP